jgi:2,3-bisphosphoglycerate-independent phosphoglycerate mutase
MLKPVVLVILDGWGISNNNQGNILKEASLPTIEKLRHFYPMTTLQASGISVGLPWGEVGNSEVGHMVIGAGKIIYQNLPRISLAIQDGTFFENKALLSAVENAKKNNSSLHLMGLLGYGSIHSYVEHIHALLELAKKHDLKNVFLHIFTDGRDSPPTSGTKSIQSLQEKINIFGVGKIATVCGRNWAMDRNNNWDRVQKAYFMLTEGAGEKIDDPIKYLQNSYAKGVTDEYVEPAVIVENGKPIGLIQDNDSVIFFNFREDRSRELTKAFILPSLEKFPRKKLLKLTFATFTEYENDLPADVAFPKEEIKMGLGEILSINNKKQLRMAETEKYAHVTYFFNGGKEEAWPGEDRLLIPSPPVASFDLAPEMSAPIITEKTLEAVEKNKYDFILINYANADMVGHTGKKEACVEAVKAIDKSLSVLIPAILNSGGCLLITADHGNIEEIKNFYTGEVDTEHSSNPVPLWYLNPTNNREKNGYDIVKQESEIGGLLSDITPTILEIMEIEKPKEVTGESLLEALK